jgi:DNA-binding MarR family transcriptional regulator
VTTTSSVERTRAEAVEDLFDGLVRVSRSLRSRSGDWSHLAGGRNRDLTRGDIVALGVIDRHGPTRPGRIAGVLAVDPSVVSRHLATLDRLGLVSRSTDPVDRRAEQISITPAGRERLAEARAAMCEALAGRLSGWDVDAIAEATTVVHRLTDLLEGPTGPAPAHDPVDHSAGTTTAAPATAATEDAHA